MRELVGAARASANMSLKLLAASSQQLAARSFIDM